MNLEEIKGRIHNYEHDYAGDSEKAYKDIAYLLSIIEQIQGGYEEIQLATKYLQHIPVMGLVYDLAEINLKAIRGN